MANDIILVIDSGGSKTHAVLYSPEGRIISEKSFGGFGYAIDEPDVDLPELAEQLSSLVGENGDSVRAVCANLGGKNDGQIRNILKRLFSKAAIAVIRESSGILMNEIRISEQADAVLLAGTGSIVLAAGSNGYFVSDGWGAEIGDAGSGYWIGREAVRASLMQLEGNEPLSILARKITGFSKPMDAGSTPDCLMTLRDAARTNIRPMDRAGIARFSRICAEAAEQGDRQALDILTRAGAFLARTCVRALKKVSAPQNAKILMIGGLANCSAYIGAGFESEIKNYSHEAVWYSKQVDLTVGAYHYCLTHLKGA